MSKRYDFILKGGKIYDGSGSPPITGDVAIKEALVKVDTGSGEKQYRFTLKNYSLFNTKNQIQQRSRWTITDIQES